MTLKLTLHTRPEAPLEAECVCPDRFKALDNRAIARLAVLHGNRPAKLGDFFDCRGRFDGHIEIDGDLSPVKHIGAAMSSGRITIAGDVGLHAGALMRGGEIVVEGQAGDWLGAEMRGGRITVRGNAGHMTGSGYRGSAAGMQGGEIIVHGQVKNETGHVMRRGLIVVAGDSGDFTGVNMLAGGIIVLGQMGIRAGAGMKRGSIISLHKAEMLPSFSLSCQYRPVFLRHFDRYLRALGIDPGERLRDGRFERWCGDAVELNRGEILLYAGQ